MLIFGKDVLKCYIFLVFWEILIGKLPLARFWHRKIFSWKFL